ncbi:MAG: MutS-related protein, partial [Candidatus Kapaibacteriota bacterium]
HIISGPNAGGKTVALKSIGLNIALACSGFFTHGYCKTSFFTIYTSIGDLQSVEQDLSTFSAQILRIKNILENSDSDTLVLIDEIVAGTDPHEGSLLAASIIDSFITMNLFFALTTHQSYLKVFSLTRPEVENDSLEFD